MTTLESIAVIPDRRSLMDCGFEYLYNGIRIFDKGDFKSAKVFFELAEGYYKEARDFFNSRIARSRYQRTLEHIF